MRCVNLQGTEKAAPYNMKKEVISQTYYLLMT